VDGGTLSRVKGYAETPLLPLDKRFVGNPEGRTFGLNHIEGLEIFASALGHELGHVFGWLTMTDDISPESLFEEPIAFPTSSGSIHTDDLLSVGIHHRDDGQREGIEIGILISGSLVLSKAESLEEASILIGVVQSTIWPWLNNNLKPFGQVEFRQGLLK
jgi:hypothetical protein